jgi:NADPH:quinone reductase-like Zn-dependent oxidoreductase
MTAQDSAGRTAQQIAAPFVSRLDQRENTVTTTYLDSTDNRGRGMSANRSGLLDAWAHERTAATAARRRADAGDEWRHLERAHVLSQPMALAHLRTHVAMLGYGLRHHDGREIVGQLVRLVVAAPGTWTGRYPSGNTGGANVSALKAMPVPDDLRALLNSPVADSRDSDAHGRDETNGADPNESPAETMKAIVQDVYGTVPETVLRLAEIARPTIGDDEILVRVAAAGVDRGTWHVMTGLPYAIRLAGFGVRTPKAPNPGRALAGTVESVGKDVTGFKPGDEVYGTCDGSFAEYARAEATKLALKPANLSFEQAAAVPISAPTALQAIRDKAKVQPGQRVLIVGASGGVGTFAVQIAKVFGAEVTAVCSTAKIDLVRSLGADHVIDYTGEDFADGEHRYDVILDIGGNRRLSHLRRALAPRGTLVIVGGETDGRWIGGFDRSLRAVLLSPFVSQTLGMLTSSENSEDLRVVGDLVESGKVTPSIERAYSLSEVSAAILHVGEGHARGKVVIAVTPPG